MDLHQKFIVEKSFFSSEKNGFILNHIYQPLIGSKAIALFNIFYDLSILKKQFDSEIFNFEYLLKNLQIETFQLLEICEKLEAIGLLRKFVNKNTNLILFSLIAPMNYQQIASLDWFKNLVIEKIGIINFDKINFMINDHKYDKSSFVEQTTKFDKHFEFIFQNKKNAPSDYDEKNQILENYQSIEKASKALFPNDFYYYLTKKKLANSFKQIVKQIYDFGFSNLAINYLMYYSFKINNDVIFNYIFKIASNFKAKRMFNFEEIKQNLNKALLSHNDYQAKGKTLETNFNHNSHNFAKIYKQFGDL